MWSRCWASCSQFIVLLLLILCFSGCRHGFRDGFYEGHLSTAKNLNTKDSKLVTQVVHIEVSHSGPNGTIEVWDQNRKAIARLRASGIQSDQFFLKVPHVRTTPFLLKKNGDCYFNLDFPSIDLCSDKRDFLLRVHGQGDALVFVLSGRKFEQDRKHVPPIKDDDHPIHIVDLDAGIRMALEKNIESKIQFQKYIQARKTAQSAFLSLLPRISLTTIGYNIPFNPGCLAAAVGDLAPFLLPTRWIKAFSNRYLAKAQETGLVIMQADLATRVEGFFAGYDKDVQMLKFYNAMIAQFTELHDWIKPLEKRKILKKGSTKHVSTILKKIQILKIPVEKGVEVDQFVLAQTLDPGSNTHQFQFLQPERQQDIQILTQAKMLAIEDVISTSLDLSLELEQANYYLLATETERKGLFLTWLDPQGDTNLNLGAGLVPQFKLSKSKAKDLELQKTFLEGIIQTKAKQVGLDYNSALTTYPLAKTLLESSERKLNRVLKRIKRQQQFDSGEIEAKLFEYMTNYSQFENLLSDFRIAKSKLERMQLQRGYEFLQERLFGLKKLRFTQTN